MMRVMHPPFHLPLGLFIEPGDSASLSQGRLPNDPQGWVEEPFWGAGGPSKAQCS